MRPCPLDLSPDACSCPPAGSAAGPLFCLPRFGRGLPCARLDQVACLFSSDAKQNLPQLLDRGLAVLEQIGHVRERFDDLLELRAVLFAQGPCPGTFQKRVKFLLIHIHPLDRSHHDSSPRSRRKSLRSGYASTSLTGRLGLLVWSSLPRPVVRPRQIQLAAR